MHNRSCRGDRVLYCFSCQAPLQRYSLHYASSSWYKQSARISRLRRSCQRHSRIIVLQLTPTETAPTRDTWLYEKREHGNQTKEMHYTLHPQRTKQQELDRGIAYAMGLYDSTLTGLELFKQDIRYWLSVWRYFGRKAFLSYEKEEIISYYDRRPWIVIVRMASVGIPLVYWFGKLVWDRVLGQSATRMPWRARELVQLVTKLGPTFIKVAQALSNRPDIVGPIWIKELEKLVDKVDPFPSDWARRLIVIETQDTPWEKRLVQISSEPVASASLGQVRIVDCNIIAKVGLGLPSIVCYGVWQI